MQPSRHSETRPGKKANLVNAASIADSRACAFTNLTSRGSTGGSGSVLSILLKTASEEHLVKERAAQTSAPRLLHVDDIDVKPLERNLIYLRNRDVPGVIGKVGTILGEHKINIANFSLGRRAAKGESAAQPEAIAVVHIDDVYLKKS